MSNHTGRLVLTTSDPQAAPDSELVAQSLSGIGFVGEPLAGEDLAYHVGPAFLRLIAFNGCAVAISSQSSGEGGVPRCHVRILPASPVARLLCGRNTRPPRCPVCRAPLQDWAERVESWLTQPQRGASCPGCGETRPPWRWDWRGQAGFGRVFVLVEDVFPGEAVPMPSLLDVLTRASGVGWRHFYVQD